MSTEVIMQKLKAIDKEVASLEDTLPWKTRIRRRYLTGRMFWATQICDSWGGIKMAVLMYLALGRQVFVALLDEYAWLINGFKSFGEWVVDAWKVSATFFHDVV